MASKITRGELLYLQGTFRGKANEKLLKYMKRNEKIDE